jgi:hypothetical protein
MELSEGFSSSSKVFTREALVDLRLCVKNHNAERHLRDLTGNLICVDHSHSQINCLMPVIFVGKMSAGQMSFE